MEQPLDAQLGLDAALENLHTAILESGAQITHDKLPEVYLYQAHLVQLFQNLIGNAIKYRSEAAPKVHIGVHKQGDSWLFSVKDNGIGIEPQYADKIFGVFKRLHKEAYPGTGIGLAICQKIVHRYRGHIWAESELGQGTTFFFTLPGAALRCQATTQTEPISIPRHGRKYSPPGFRWRGGTRRFHSKTPIASA